MSRHRSTRKLPSKLVLGDPRALAAISHPARARIVDELYAGQRMTASELAPMLGLSASAASYHLRTLARWGLVRRIGGRPDARERPYERAADRLVWSTDVASEAVSEALTAQYLARLHADLQRWSALASTETS